MDYVYVLTTFDDEPIEAYLDFATADAISDGMAAAGVTVSLSRIPLYDLQGPDLFWWEGYWDEPWNPRRLLAEAIEIWLLTEDAVRASLDPHYYEGMG